MILLAALLALSTPVVYQIPSETPARYDVSVAFDGYVPLFGGQEAQIDVEMVVEAKAQGPDAEGRPQAMSEIKEIRLTMNGAELPVDASQITRFFPRATISMTPQGRILANSAPDVNLPIRLPGLHPKRFPDITYLPLEFPVEGIEVDKEFRVKKMFGDSPVDYHVTPKAIGEREILLDVKINQVIEAFEDRWGNPVEAAGERKVNTVVAGEGTAAFDRTRGLVSRFRVSANAVSKVTEVSSGRESNRRLKTVLDVKLREAGK
jgi:hypothetical protein